MSFCSSSSLVSPTSLSAEVEWNPTSGRYGIRTNRRPLEKTGEAIGELNDKLGRKGAKSSHPIEAAILLSRDAGNDFNGRRKAG